jgi:SAM-dependent methyltransferase
MIASAEPRPYGGQAHVYDHEYQAYVDDIPFYLERLRDQRVSGPVLELGAGTGRVAIPLAEAGYRITGIDLSEPMLRRARRRRRSLAPDVAARLRFLRRDITTFALEPRFGAALIPFSTLALLPTAEQRAACLERTCVHLEPGAPLYIDLFAFRAGDVPADRVRYHERFRVPPYGHTIEKAVEEVYDPDHRVKRITYFYRKKPYFGQRILGEFTVAFALALLSREEVEQGLERAGFDVEMIYGDYRARPFGPRSDRMIFEARRR